MFWGFIFIAIGVGWMLQYAGIIPADMEFFWSVLFIGLGLSFIFEKKGDGCCGWSEKKDKR